MGDTLSGLSRDPLVIFITIPGRLEAGMMWNFWVLLQCGKRCEEGRKDHTRELGNTCRNSRQTDPRQNFSEPLLLLCRPSGGDEGRLRTERAPGTRGSLFYITIYTECDFLSVLDLCINVPCVK